MTEDELKKLGRNSRQLSHIYNELNEGQQRIVSGVITDIESILDSHQFSGIVREIRVVK